MKIAIKEKPIKPNRVPNVGEPWRYVGSKVAFMRIPDEVGRLVCSGADGPSVFYSINLESGQILWLSSGSPIEILRLVGGEILFEPADQ